MNPRHYPSEAPYPPRLLDRAGKQMGRAISMSEAIAIEVEVEVDVEGDRHRRQALVAAVGKYLAAHDPDKASHPALLEREDCTLVAWYRCLRTSRGRGV